MLVVLIGLAGGVALGSLAGALLAAALALAALVALGLALAASVRRCSRDLALLRVLGFAQRQLAGAVADTRRSRRQSGS